MDMKRLGRLVAPLNTTSIVEIVEGVSAMHTRIERLERGGGYTCGNTHGQWKCNIHRGHEGCHMAASNGFVLGAWS